MVPDISRGGRTIGLLAYLYGPGRRDEHVDPHLVASWEDFTPDPGRHPGVAIGHLAQALDLYVRQRENGGRGRPDKYVWHCPVRTAPGDRVLTDDEWAMVARRVVAATRIAPEGDEHGCRWIAVRHSEDHIHIVATTVRANLALARNSYDYKRAQEECRRIEVELGLRKLDRGDGTAARRPTSAERFKAARRGQPRTAREELRSIVRRAIAGTANEQEFFARLRRSGIRVNQRTAPSGDVIGYSVALVGDRNRDDTPIWFSGSTLGADLSLPRLRLRFAGATPGMTEGVTDARAVASAALGEAIDHLGIRATDAHPGAAAARLAGIGEVLDALAASQVEGVSRGHLDTAADFYERVVRSRTAPDHSESGALRRAARELATTPSRCPNEVDQTFFVVVTLLVEAAIAAARWHGAHGHKQQAAAALRTTVQLTFAVQSITLGTPAFAAATSVTAVDGRRRTTQSAAPQHLRDRVGNVQVLAETLSGVELAGHDASDLLEQAVNQGHLDGADNIAHVLAWRIRQLAQLPATTGGPLKFSSTRFPTVSQLPPSRNTTHALNRKPI